MDEILNRFETKESFTRNTGKLSKLELRFKFSEVMQTKAFQKFQFTHRKS